MKYFPTTDFVYIADSATGLFKVGRTYRPLVRGKQIAVEFTKRGHPMRRIMFFPVGSVGTVETEVVHALRAMQCEAPNATREWFRGVDWDLAKEMVATLARDRRIELARIEAARAARIAAARAERAARKAKLAAAAEKRAARL